MTILDIGAVCNIDIIESFAPVSLGITISKYDMAISDMWAVCNIDIIEPCVLMSLGKTMMSMTWPYQTWGLCVTYEMLI